MLRWLLIMVFCGLGCCALAQGGVQPLTPARQLIGLADIIATGTVTAVAPGGDAVIQTPMIQATIALDRPLKGPALQTVVVQAPVQGEDILVPQARHLFFLQRAPQGYIFAGGMGSIHPFEEADAVAKAIADFPVEIYLERPVGPFFFGQALPVQVHIKNRSQVDYSYSYVQLQGYYYTPRLNAFVHFADADRPQRPGMEIDYLYPMRSLAPGAEETATFRAQADTIPAWNLFTPDTYLQTAVAVRMTILVQTTAMNRTTAPIPVATPWVTAMLGFPVPDEVALPGK